MAKNKEAVECVAGVAPPDQLDVKTGELRPTGKACSVDDRWIRATRRRDTGGPPLVFLFRQSVACENNRVVNVST